MTTDTSLIDIGEFKQFIKDEKLDAFAKKLCELASCGVTLMKQNGELVCGFIGKDAARDLMYANLRKKIIEHPDILERIKSCLDDDDLVD